MQVFKELQPEQRRSLIILAFGGMLFWLSLTLLLPTLPLYIQSVGGTKQQIGFVMGAFALGLLPSRLWLGPAADRKGRKMVLLIGTTVAMIAPLGYLFVKSIPLLMVVRAFHGISVAALTTGYSTLVADISPPQKRGELIGYMSLVAPIGMSFGPAIGGFLHAAGGYTPLFLLASILGLLSCCFTLQVLEPEKHLNLSAKIDSDLPKSFWKILISPQVRIPTLVMLFVGIVFGNLITFMPLFLQETKVNLNPGLFYSTAAIVSFAMRLLTGRASDKYGRGLFITFGIGFYIASMLTLWLAYNAPSFLLGALLEGVAAGTVIPMMVTLMTDRALPQQRGQYLSICIGGFDLGGALAGPLLGSMAEFVGYRNIFGVSTCMSVFALVLFLTLSSKNFRQSFNFALGKSADYYAIELEPNLSSKF